MGVHDVVDPGGDAPVDDDLDLVVGQQEVEQDTGGLRRVPDPQPAEHLQRPRPAVAEMRRGRGLHRDHDLALVPALGATDRLVQPGHHRWPEMPAQQPLAVPFGDGPPSPQSPTNSRMHRRLRSIRRRR
jgi:hypothetical protein